MAPLPQCSCIQASPRFVTATCRTRSRFGSVSRRINPAFASRRVQRDQRLRFRDVGDWRNQDDGSYRVGRSSDVRSAIARSNRIATGGLSTAGSFRTHSSKAGVSNAWTPFTQVTCERKSLRWLPQNLRPNPIRRNTLPRILRKTGLARTLKRKSA